MFTQLTVTYSAVSQGTSFVPVAEKGSTPHTAYSSPSQCNLNRDAQAACAVCHVLCGEEALGKNALPNALRFCTILYLPFCSLTSSGQYLPLKGIYTLKWKCEQPQREK